MKITGLLIGGWRNIDSLKLEPAQDENVVCLVGDNGTGKTNILELLHYACNEVGLSRGLGLERGDPSDEPHFFGVRFDFSDVREDYIDPTQFPDHLQDLDADWDGSIELWSYRDEGGLDSNLIAGGIDAPGNRASSFASQVQTQLQNSGELHFLWLDSNRAYPRQNIQFRDAAQIMQHDLEDVGYREARAYRTSGQKYSEWVKEFVAWEQQENNAYIDSVREARDSGVEEPEFKDPFDPYRTELRSVMPHLTFRGVVRENPELKFSSHGEALPFSKLSGGEKEIAFLVGQIIRFGLEDGVFLLDEPELHLNPDLIRKWVSYLTDSIVLGQVWLATHSLEAVEAVGPEATYLLERGDDKSGVDKVVSFEENPLLPPLAGTLGYPAFSLHDLQFVIIEGDGSGQERERLRNLLEEPERIRIIEGTSAAHVRERVDFLRDLAEQAEEPLQVGGILDRDFRDGASVAELEAEGLHVLSCHEVENIYLHPDSLANLMESVGVDDASPGEIIRQASDDRFGLWLFKKLTHHNDNPELTQTQPRSFLRSLQWHDVDDEVQQLISAVAARTEGELTETVSQEIQDAVEEYTDLREDEDELWRHCKGKEVLSALPEHLPLDSTPSTERALRTAWQLGDADPPPQISEMKEYIEAL